MSPLLSFVTYWEEQLFVFLHGVLKRSQTAMKDRRKDETTKTTILFGITLGKANADIVDGE